ncbi:hypothetical protein [Enterococcus casseliflavus]|uniref:hypothetical protein n=1 Tax=Enterococcus casseliflavus TaxID=37734 RepID=UPI001E483665|nr:hypothetical protein [Enterococcus casseliflavus]MCD5161419.1 hypothetical protein [Enterococcus casseliflavus]MCD5192651.1 hypothetical protein [Enterococcus casseliflavus]
MFYDINTARKLDNPRQPYKKINVKEKVKAGVDMIKKLAKNINMYLGVINIVIGLVQLCFLSKSSWYLISGVLLILSGFIQIIVAIRHVKGSE